MADNYTALKSAQKKRYISKETFNSLDLSQIPVGSEYEVVSPIEKGDLSADINNALNKAENALPKPTNDTTGSAGQVLKKTANGSEWGDAPSGGGKLYAHLLTIRFKDPSGNSVTMYSQIYSPINTAVNNSAALVSLLNRQHVPAWGYALNSNYFNPYFIQSLYGEGTHFRYQYISLHSTTEFQSGDNSGVDCTEIIITDTVIEL